MPTTATIRSTGRRAVRCAPTGVAAAKAAAHARRPRPRSRRGAITSAQRAAPRGDRLGARRDGRHRLVVGPRRGAQRIELRVVEARQTFAVKCVGYLQQGSSVVVVDTVTTRRADLFTAILSLLGVAASTAAPPSSLSAVSYRAVGREEETQQLHLWPAPLALGQPLPPLPLWIAADFSVPLDLEASYRTTCADLRVHQAGLRLHQAE